MHGQSSCSDYMGDGVKKKVVKWKIYAIGNVVGYCCVLNYEESLIQMHNDLMLSASVAEIGRKEAEDDKKGKDQEEEGGGEIKKDYCYWGGGGGYQILGDRVGADP